MGNIVCTQGSWIRERANAGIWVHLPPGQQPNSMSVPCSISSTGMDKKFIVRLHLGGNQRALVLSPFQEVVNLLVGCLRKVFVPQTDRMKGLRSIMADNLISFVP